MNKDVLFRCKSALLRPQVRATGELLADLKNITAHQLRELHLLRRTETVLYAYDKTCYYRRVFDAAGFHRRDLEQPQNFEHLPILTREAVRENFDDIISSDFGLNGIGITSTGGSTGTPLRIGTDPRYALEVISWRRLAHWGAGPGENSGYIYRVIPTGRSALARKIFFYPTKRCYLRAAQMSEQQMQNFITTFNQNNGKYIVAYVGALKIFADFLASEGMSLSKSLKFIMSTAAPMPVYLQQQLEAVFQVPIYSQYGSAEFYWIAAERLTRDGLDVDWDIRSVEILDANGNLANVGEFGNLVVTDFINRAFPMVRYQIGDRGRFIPAEKCNDDALPILDYVKGRRSQTLKLRDGREVPGEFWTTIFDEYPDAISSFSVHQQKDASIRIRYQPTKRWDNNVKKHITTVLRQVCGETTFELVVDDGTPQDRGKLNYVTSELQE